MANFLDVLKEVENGAMVGFRQGAWFPHKSAEGGTRTIAYGHKLSQAEDTGNFIELPDGTVVDLNSRGLTPDEAEQLLQNDIRRHRRVAETQWNASQSTEFSSLNPLHQDILTEIAFNIGTLNSGKKFGWPSLAKGILNNDTDVIKQEISRSFTDAQGRRRQLTSRVNKIRGFIDEYIQNPQQSQLLTPPQAQAAQQQPVSRPEDVVQPLVDTLNQFLNTPQRSSQTPSEAPVEPVVEQPQFTPEEEQFIQLGVERLRRGRTIKEGEARLEREFQEAQLAETARQSRQPVTYTAEEEQFINLMVDRVKQAQESPNEEDRDFIREIF